MVIRLDVDSNNTTKVSCKTMVIPGDLSAPLLLDGHDLEIERVRINHTLVTNGRGYRLIRDGDRDVMEIDMGDQSVGQPCLVEIDTIPVKPNQNPMLSGLYKSNNIYIAHCEGTGFRRITFFPDRPDVLAKFRVKIEADRESCPILFSNGDMVAHGDLEEGRHFCEFVDSNPKPCSMFAIVAGDLGNSNQTLADLNIYSEHKSANQLDLLDRLDRAIASFKAAMKWDQDWFFV